MKETINIIFSSDNNYAQFMGVTICSLFENKKCKNNIDIYVLDGGIKKGNKYKLSILENKYKFKINYIKIDKKIFKDFHIFGHFTQAAYYRIIIPNLLPNLNKVLYLDCDIIINTDINNLYSIDIDNYYLAAIDEGVKDRQIDLNIPINSNYFNSGIMLMNLKKWRDSNIINDLIVFIKLNPKKLIACDQDALNALLYKKWLNIDKRFNYTSLLYYNNPIKIENIFILHFTGLKPWNYLCPHPLKYTYFYYLNKTPWKYKKYIDKTFLNIIKNILKKVLKENQKNILKKVLKKL